MKTSHTTYETRKGASAPVGRGAYISIHVTIIMLGYRHRCYLYDAYIRSCLERDYFIGTRRCMTCAATTSLRGPAVPYSTDVNNVRMSSLQYNRCTLSSIIYCIPTGRPLRSYKSELSRCAQLHDY